MRRRHNWHGLNIIEHALLADAATLLGPTASDVGLKGGIPITSELS